MINFNLILYINQPSIWWPSDNNELNDEADHDQATNIEELQESDDDENNEKEEEKR